MIDTNGLICWRIYVCLFPINGVASIRDLTLEIVTGQSQCMIKFKNLKHPFTKRNINKHESTMSDHNAHNQISLELIIIINIRRSYKTNNLMKKASILKI